MSFEERRTEATFRGIQFMVDSVGYKHGRNLAKYEYVDSENWSVIDRGIKILEFDINGFISRGEGENNNYDLERDLLISALSRPGIGVLKLPHLRRRYDVLIEEFEVSEKSPLNTRADFNFSCSVVGNRLLPSLFRDFLDDLNSAIEIIRSILQNNLVTDLENFTIETVALLKEAIDLILAPISQASSLLSFNPTDLFNFNSSRSNYDSRINFYVENPGELLSEVLFSTERLFLNSNPNDLENIIGSFAGQSDQNFQSAFRKVSILGLVRVIPSLTYRTLEEAIQLRQNVISLIDSEIEGLEISLLGRDCDLLIAFKNLRSSLIRSFPNDREFSTIQIENNGNYNSISFLHKNSGSTNSLDSFIENNNIENPLLLQGSKTFEI